MSFLFTMVSSILAVLIGMGAASSALAQKRPPTVQYNDPPVTMGYNDPIPTIQYKDLPATPLDKNFGLPTFGMQGGELPQQKTQAPIARAPEPVDVFKAYTGLPGLNAPNPDIATAAADEQDFFKDVQEILLPRNQLGMAALNYTTSYGAPDNAPTDTPQFTTRQLYLVGSTNAGMTTDSMTTGRFGTGDAPDAGDTQNQ